MRLAVTAAVLLAAAASEARAVGGIHKIRHVVIIMQENRSFDNYFGTFPGADGIPRRHGRPTVCSAGARFSRPLRSPVARLSMAIGFSPLAATKFPTGGHHFSPLVAIRSPQLVAMISPPGWAGFRSGASPLCRRSLARAGSCPARR